MALGFIQAQLPDAVVEKIDVTAEKNHRKFVAALKECELDSRGVPVIIAGGRCWQGFSEDVGAEIKKVLKN